MGDYNVYRLVFHIIDVRFEAVTAVCDEKRRLIASSNYTVGVDFYSLLMFKKLSLIVTIIIKQ